MFWWSYKQLNVGSCHVHTNSQFIGEDTLALFEREYTLLETPPKPRQHLQITEFDEEVKVKPRESQNWTERMKEKYCNFMYKMNHSGSYISQYNKLDYKNCDKREIRLMCGHVFKKAKCREEVEDVFRNIILFTYRKDFINPLETVSKKTGRPKQLKSDFGWG